MSIQLDHVTTVYDPDAASPVTALKDVSLILDRPQFIGIIGHTGSGKSTLIQHMNGLLKPTSGRVLFNGEDIWGEHYRRRNLRSKVGLVFQYPEYQLFEETVFKDVCFGPKNLGLAEEEQERRAKAALAMVGIEEDQYALSPFELSGGQKRRVAIAGVLAMEPEILILDEPTAGLDPKGRDDILSCLQDLFRTKQITVVLVSHRMEDVASFADRIIVIDEGRIAFDAPPAEIFRHTEELERMGLAVPQVTYLMRELAELGLPVPRDIITVEEAAKALAALVRERRGK